VTLIVWRSPVLAADTASFRDSFICDRNRRKIIRAHGHLVGCAGIQAYNDRFMAWAQKGFPEHETPPPIDKDKENEFAAIVVRPDGRVLEYGPDMLTTDCTTEPFTIVGSSLDFASALGTLGWSAVDIVKHAIKHTVWAAGDVYSLTLDGRAQLIDGETAEPKVVQEDIAEPDIGAEPGMDAPTFTGYSPANKGRMQDSAETDFLHERGLA
jgi:hypothetical protein